jgi:hypothetical protein
MEVVKLADVMKPNFMVEDEHFENALIVGPAIIAPLGENTFANCTFEGSPDSIFYEVPPERVLVGVVGIRNVTFDGCRLSGIGIIGTSDSLKAFREGFQEEPSALGKSSASVSSS